MPPPLHLPHSPPPHLRPRPGAAGTGSGCPMVESWRRRKGSTRRGSTGRGVWSARGGAVAAGDQAQALASDRAAGNERQKCWLEHAGAVEERGSDQNVLGCQPSVRGRQAAATAPRRCLASSSQSCIGSSPMHHISTVESAAVKHGRRASQQPGTAAGGTGANVAERCPERAPAAVPCSLPTAPGSEAWQRTLSSHGVGLQVLQQMAGRRRAPHACRASGQQQRQRAAAAGHHTQRPACNPPAALLTHLCPAQPSC